MSKVQSAKPSKKSANPVIVAKVAKAKGKTTPKVEAKPEIVVKVSKAKLGVGKLVAESIMAGKLDNNAILALVKEKIPAAKTTYACIAWYRTKLRKEGTIQ